MIMAVLLPVSGFKKPEELTRFTLLEHHMGIDARIILYAPNQQVVDAAGEAAFQRIADLEAIMSDYIKGFDAGCNFMVNEIKQLQRKYGDNVPLSTLLEHLTKESK
jgi:hypothetical protein